jgi:hypothetical protein
MYMVLHKSGELCEDTVAYLVDPKWVAKFKEQFDNQEYSWEAVSTIPASCTLASDEPYVLGIWERGELISESGFQY